MAVYKYTLEMVKEYVQKHGQGTVLLSNGYVDSDHKIRFKCSCSKAFVTTFSKFKNRGKTKCNECNGFTKWDYETTKQLFVRCGLTPIFEKFEGTISPLKKLDALTKEGYKVQGCADKLKIGKVPMPFSKYNPYSIDNIQKFINDNDLGMVLLSSEYKNNQERLEMVCSKGHYFNVPWADFQSRKRCTKCYYSKGEEKIESWLASENIKYKIEFTFSDLRGEGNQPLRYDFAVFENGELKMLIEYDGELHFEPARYSKRKGENLIKLNRTKKYDDMKNDYAKRKNIKLLRIPYTQYENIEKILATHL